MEINGKLFSQDQYSKNLGNRSMPVNAPSQIM